MSLFSSTNQQKPNLFGSTNLQPQQQTSSLFGSQQQQPQQQSGSMFGAQQPAKPTLSLFSSSTQQNAGATGGGLFASAQQPQVSNAGGLFQSAQQKPTLSLFSASQQGAGQQQQQQPQSTFGGFGAGAANQPQQPQQQSVFGGLGASMGGQQQQQPQTMFGNLGATVGNQQQQQQQQQQQMGASFLGGSVGGSSIWQPSQNAPSRNQSVPDQITTLKEKWNPESTSCVFQHYFYNQVSEEQAPYYAPGPNEDEKKWEEALKKKPSPGAIPVLARGPLAVGRRLETQANWVRGIQTRLHDLNDVLTKRMQKHDLEYSIRAQEARRKHVVLSRRCLALASRIQVMRNRGYALDSTEEQLRAKLVQLEKVAFDPMLSGRQEEIWARMSVVRQRAQMLQMETEKLGKEVNASTEELIDDEQMKRVERILSNYEAQLNQLKKERESAETDFLEWQTATQSTTAPNR